MAKPTRLNEQPVGLGLPKDLGDGRRERARKNAALQNAHRKSHWRTGGEPCTVNRTAVHCVRDMSGTHKELSHHAAAGDLPDKDRVFGLALLLSLEERRIDPQRAHLVHCIRGG